MNFSQLKAETLAHGFESAFYLDRVGQYINDGYMLVCRRVNYYVDEATQDFPTVAGQSTYPFPANFARMRSLRNPSLSTELQSALLRDIDRSDQTASGQPRFYAIDGPNLHLYPTPDAVYNLELRYWLLPQLLVQDSDVPTLPADWHRLLWYWAVREAFMAEDDPQTAQTWEQQFNTALSEFAADQKFPDGNFPTVVRGMWDQDVSLTAPGAWGGGYW